MRIPIDASDCAGAPCAPCWRRRGLGACAAAHAQGTLVVSIAADPTGFDPEAVENNTSGFVMGVIHDSLVAYKPGTTEVGPGLAAELEVSPDGHDLHFPLRTGVKFHDSTPFQRAGIHQDAQPRAQEGRPEHDHNTGSGGRIEEFTYGAVTSYAALDNDTRFSSS